MIPKLVTFDCAQTLIRVPDNWTLGKFSVDCARHLGIEASAEQGKLYDRMYMQRLPEFCAMNQSRDPEKAKAYWRQLASDWLEAAGMPVARLDDLLATADELCFGPNSIVFSMYDDVLPCLDKLDQMGIRMAVISNWDHSLPRVLKMFGILERFVSVKASLEEGVEKPDPRLFEIVLADAGFSAEEAFHVGDLVEDDLEGARAAGIRAALIDRAQFCSAPPRLSTLIDLPEAFVWTD